jgi:hypothetical protein
MQMQLPDELTVGENALSRFSKGPFDKFKLYAEFSPVDAIVEEILGRIGCLRRNQRIVDVGSNQINHSHKLLRDHEMVVLNIARVGDDLKDLEKGYRNLIVHFNMFNESVDDIAKQHGIPNEFPLLCLDSSIQKMSFQPYVVVATINPSTRPDCDYPGGFKATNAFWNDEGYDLVAMVDKYVVYIRSDLTNTAEVKGVVLRNPTMLFDWRHIK